MSAGNHRGQCKICSDPRRGAIDGAILAGKTFRQIAAEFGVCRATAHKHSTHAKAGIERMAARVTVAYGRSIKVYVSKLQEEMLQVTRAARLAGNHGAAVAAAQAGRELAETQRKLLTRVADPKAKGKPGAEPAEIQVEYEEGGHVV